MIVDLLSPRFLQISYKYNLRPWQSGVLADTISSVEHIRTLVSNGVRLRFDHHLVKHVNMGPQSGHTYVARIAALQEFPIRTQVYVSRPEAINEFKQPISLNSSYHETVSILREDSFVAYQDHPVELIVIDMNSETTRRFRASFDSLRASVPKTTIVLILQAAQ